MPVWRWECCLLSILFFHSNLKEAVRQVKYAKVFGASQSVEDLQDAGKWISISRWGRGSRLPYAIFYFLDRLLFWARSKEESCKATLMGELCRFLVVLSFVVVSSFFKGWCTFPFSLSVSLSLLRFSRVRDFESAVSPICIRTLTDVFVAWRSSKIGRSKSVLQSRFSVYCDTPSFDKTKSKEKNSSYRSTNRTSYKKKEIIVRLQTICVRLLKLWVSSFDSYFIFRLIIEEQYKITNC